MSDTASAQNVQSIKLDLIDPPAFNSRLGYDAANPDAAPDKELQGLAKSMANGQEQPIKVEQTGEGRYTLVFGSRRYRAARLLKWETISAIVVPPLSDVDRILANGIENLQREDLSSYEQARLCAQLREKGLKLNECADRLGFSGQKVSNYTRAFTLLAPSIKEEWRKGDKVLAMEFLIEIAGIKGDTDAERFKLQTEAWEARKELQRVADDILAGADETEDHDEEDDADDKGEGKPAKPKDFKVKRDWYKYIVKALQAKRSVPGASLAAQVLDLAIGKIDGVRGLTSKAEFDKAKDLKKSNQA